MQDLLIKQLKNIDINPRAEWKESTRSFLMSEIKADRYAEINLSQNNLWNNFRFIKFAWRPVGVFALIAMLFMGSTGLIMAAAQNSTPGSKMFVVKRMIEKSQGLITTDSSQRVELATTLLGNRVDELQKIMVEESQLKAPGSNSRQNKVALAVVEIKKQLSDVDDSLEELKINNDGKKTAIAALVLNKKIRSYKNELKQIRKKGITNNIDDDLEEALNQVGEINNNVLEVIIDKQQKGELTIDNSEIKDKLVDHISDIEEKVDAVEKILADNTSDNITDESFIERADEAKKKIEDAKKAIKNNEFNLVLTLAKGSNDILKILYGDIYKEINSNDNKDNEEDIVIDNEQEIKENRTDVSGQVEGVETINVNDGEIIDDSKNNVSKEEININNIEDENKDTEKTADSINNVVKDEEFNVGIK